MQAKAPEGRPGQDARDHCICHELPGATFSKHCRWRLMTEIFAFPKACLEALGFLRRDNAMEDRCRGTLNCAIQHRTRKTRVC